MLYYHAIEDLIKKGFRKVYLGGGRYDYKKNSKAADNLLKLGLTMNKLNKKTEACTAFKSLSTEFPKADKKLKDRAAAEAKKLSCK